MPPLHSRNCTETRSAARALPRCGLTFVHRRAMPRAGSGGAEREKNRTTGERAKAVGSLLLVSRERVGSADVSPNAWIALQGHLVKAAANQENHPDCCPYQRGKGEKLQRCSLDAPGRSKSMSSYKDSDRIGNASSRKASGRRGRAEPPFRQD